MAGGLTLDLLYYHLQLYKREPTAIINKEVKTFYTRQMI